MRQYFQEYSWSGMSEPRDVKSEFLEIAKIIVEVNSILEERLGNSGGIQK